MRTLFLSTCLVLIFVGISCGSDDDIVEPGGMEPEVPIEDTVEVTVVDTVEVSMDDTLMACVPPVFTLPNLDSWELQVVNPMVSGTIHMLTPTNGLVVTGNNVYQTTDGLASLVELEGQVPSNRQVLEIISENEWIIAQHSIDSEGYFVSTILKTTDGGLSWDTLTSQDRDLLYVTSLHFVDNQKGFAIASLPYLGSGFSPRLVLRTIDGGNTWKEVEGISQGKAGAYRPMIQFVDESVGYFLGRIRLYKTVDGGLSFEQQGDFMNLIDFYALDEDIIYGASSTKTYLSTNGGQTWEEILDFPATLLNIEGSKAVLLGNSGNTRCLNESMAPTFQSSWTFAEGVDGTYQVDSASIIGHRLNYVKSFPQTTIFSVGSKVVTVRQ